MKLEIKKPTLKPLSEKKEEKSESPKEKKEESKGLCKSTFLYMEPKKDIKDFAQCSSCRMFIKDKNLCSLHGDKVKILPTDSCGFYIYGIAPDDEDDHVEASVTPEESGLVHEQVRCENCIYLQDDGDHFDCLLFKLLNIEDHTIKKLGCCNGFKSKKE